MGFTDASTRRGLKRRLPRSVPRGLKSSKEQLLEPHSKTLWLKGIRNPKCARPNVNKPTKATTKKAPAAGGVKAPKPKAAAKAQKTNMKAAPKVGGKRQRLLC